MNSDAVKIHTHRQSDTFLFSWPIDNRSLNKILLVSHLKITATYTSVPFLLLSVYFQSAPWHLPYADINTYIFKIRQAMCIKFSV